MRGGTGVESDGPFGHSIFEHFLDSEKSVFLRSRDFKRPVLDVLGKEMQYLGHAATFLPTVFFTYFLMHRPFNFSLLF